MSIACNQLSFDIHTAHCAKYIENGFGVTDTMARKPFSETNSLFIVMKFYFWERESHLEEVHMRADPKQPRQ